MLGRFIIGLIGSLKFFFIGAFSLFIFGDWYIGLIALFIGILIPILCAKDKDAFK